MRAQVVRLLLVLMSSLLPLHASVPGDEHWDTRFDLSGVNHDLFGLLSTNNRIYAGGLNFYQGATNTQVNIWNGTNWSLLPPLSGGVAVIYDLAWFNNELYVAGTFSRAGVSTNAGLARWDGFSWRDVGGFRGVAGVLRIHRGELYAGGSFTNLGGILATNIARWDGTHWHALGMGVGPYLSGTFAVADMATLNNDLVVGGQFSTAGSGAATNLARWDGTNWTAFSAFNGRVEALAVITSSIYVGGTFTTIDGLPFANIALWSGTWSPLGAGVNSSVYDIALLGTNVFVAGAFTNASGTPATRIARWNGTGWFALGGGLNDTPNRLLAVGTNIIAAGLFNQADSLMAGHIAVWDGFAWSSLSAPRHGHGITLSVRAVAATPTNLYAGGIFTGAGRVKASRIAKWDGTNWSAMGSGVKGTNEGTGTSINAIAVRDGDVFVGGVFTNAGGVAASNIARWNGSAWSPLGVGVGNSVLALAVVGNDLYAGGNFTSAGGQARIGIARWDGANWNTVGGGLTAPAGITINVAAMAVSGTNLYIGGTFHGAGGVNATNIARWDGFAWSALGTGVNTNISALAVSGTNLYAGGRFTLAGGVTVSKVARWDGFAWSDVGGGVAGSGTPTVTSMAAVSNALYIGGTFSTVGGGITANRLARWDGTWSPLGNSITLSSGSSGAVSAMAAAGFDLYLGGIFEVAGDKPQSNFAHWNEQKNLSPMQIQLTPAPLPAGVQIIVLADHADTFVVESSGDLRAWAPLLVTNAVPVTIIDSNPPPAGRRYYRARQDY